MARFLVPPSSIRGTSFRLSGSEAHHALHVLRKKVGDEIDLFDGQDASYRGRIDSAAAGEIRGTILGRRASSVLPIHLTLFQALTRGSKWEWLLEKAGEVGVERVVPVISRRTLIKLEAGQAREKLKRWNRIALAASKQCGRSDVMAVETPQPFAGLLGVLEPSSLSLIPWEKESERTIQAACRGYQGKKINLFIGPEGGWDPSEIDPARRAGAIPVRLGPTLLRAETAGLIAAALVLREFGIY